MDTQAAQLSLRNVAKGYGRNIVLEGVDLDVTQGEILVFIGRSGSGKSTLLRIIGGLEEPSGGTVSFHGRDIGRMSEAERALFRRQSLGFVFQFFNLIPTLTVGENVRLPLELNGATGQLAAQRASRLLDELGLGASAGRFPEELSGGEQQRVAIARALVHEPELVVADEPTGNLDIETATDVLELLNTSCRQAGTTLIMATHSTEVIGLADRVLPIRGSRIELPTA